MGVARETPRSLTSERFEETFTASAIGHLARALSTHQGEKRCDPIRWGRNDRKPPTEVAVGAAIPETVPLDLEAETANGLGFA
jgi:hypothetical protein